MIRLAWHLERHVGGVNLWHEVEINHRLGPVQGSETDILATVQTDAGAVAVVIEGKGNWNREVETAIDTQLYDRYLTGNPTYNGIYVVAAFRSDDWAETDDRKQRAAAHEAADLRNSLAETANRLSRGERRIAVRVIDVPLEQPA